MASIQISTMISIGSLVLGFVAWLLGIFAIMRAKSRISYTATVCSFSLCAVSLILQLFEVQNRVTIGDYAAIEDTIGATLFAAITLVAVNIVLNIVAIAKSKKR